MDMGYPLEVLRLYLRKFSANLPGKSSDTHSTIDTLTHKHKTGINLQRNPELYLLDVNMGLSNPDVSSAGPELVARWFKSICDSVVSQTFRVQISDFPEEPSICTEIEDALLELKERIHVLVVYVDEERDDRWDLFPRLYDKRIMSDEYESWLH